MSRKKSSIQFKAGVIITVGMLFATFSFYGYQLLFTPNIQLERANTYLYIPTGSNYQQVKDSLIKNDILNDKISFFFLAKLLKYPENVKPGRYLMESNATNLNTLKALKQGRQSPVKVTINNVRLKSELADKLSKKLEFTSEQFLTLIESDTFLNKTGLNKNTVIGMFIPNTYEFYWNISAHHFTEKMQQEYEKFWNSERKQKANEIGFTPSEVTTLASIVEAETNYNEEKPRVAGVYINRLKSNMPLQADPTLKYAIGDFTIKRIYSGHIAFDSPYNTYMYAGLPPGPINLPGISSIDAVLNYEKHQFLYFCAHPDLTGKHEFSVNFEDHLKIASRYREALNKLNIR